MIDYERDSLEQMHSPTLICSMKPPNFASEPSSVIGLMIRSEIASHLKTD